MRLALFAALAGVAVAGTVHAAEMPMKAPMRTAAQHDWSGFYVGGNLGHGWGNGDTSFTPLPDAVSFLTLAPTTFSPNPKGMLGGLQAGYNFQTGHWVWGLETDFQWSNLKGSLTQNPLTRNDGTPQTGLAQTSEEVRWLGTLRARAGFTPVNRLLLYATGGLAYGKVNYAAITDFRPAGGVYYAASASKTKVGWTVGAGLEWAFARHWSAKLEYLYVDLGKESATANAVPANPPFQVAYDWKTTENIVRIGLNYKFGP